MAQANSRVRTAIPPVQQAATRRTLDERARVALPGMTSLLNRLLFKLPPHSSLRRRVLVRSVQRSFAALNRGDWRLNMLTLYDRDVELVWPLEAPPGAPLDPVIGREQAFAQFVDWTETWQEHKRFPREVIDLGNRIVVLFDQRATGSQAGMDVSMAMANVMTIRDGLIVKHEEWTDQQKALEAVGLSE